MRIPIKSVYSEITIFSCRRENALSKAIAYSVQMSILIATGINIAYVWYIFLVEQNMIFSNDKCVCSTTLHKQIKAMKFQP